MTSPTHRPDRPARTSCKPSERARDAVRCCFWFLLRFVRARGWCPSRCPGFAPNAALAQDAGRTQLRCALCLPRTDQRPRCGATLEPARAACTAVAVAAAVGHHGHPPASPQRSYSHCNTQRHTAVQRATASPTPPAAGPYKPSGTCSWTSRASVARCRTRRPLARHVQQPSVSLPACHQHLDWTHAAARTRSGSVMGWPCACHRMLLELSEPLHPPSHAPRVARAQDCANLRHACKCCSRWVRVLV